MRSRLWCLLHEYDLILYGIESGNSYDEIDKVEAHEAIINYLKYEYNYKYKRNMITDLKWVEIEYILHNFFKNRCRYLISEVEKLIMEIIYKSI